MERRWHYIDMHTHILYEVDDGAEDIRESVHMAEQAYQEGIRIIVATPHYGSKNPSLDQNQVTEKWKKLARLIDTLHPDMAIVLGNELYYRPGIINDVKTGRAKTIGNTRYVLVEFSPRDSYRTIQECMYECNINGYIPIIAHVERYDCFVGQANLIRDLKEQGAVIQVNCRTFINGGMLDRKEWAEELLSKQLVDLIASDCHDSEGRTPIMETAVQRLISLAGEKEVYKIISTNPKKILKNERL